MPRLLVGVFFALYFLLAPQKCVFCSSLRFRNDLIFIMESRIESRYEKPWSKVRNTFILSLEAVV